VKARFLTVSGTVLAVMAMGVCCLGRLNHSGTDADPRVQVPLVVGATMDAAGDRLRKEDLEPSASDIYGHGGWGGDDAVVVAVKPTSGTSVKRYSTVAITYATRSEIVFYKSPMPKFIGLQWDDLTQGRLKDLYLHVDVTYRDARGSEKPGSVVRQVPEAGAKLKLGSKLKMTVANEVYTDPGSSAGGGVDLPNINWPNHPCRHTKWC
jgi:beta-lactam-binding protein with PASTA domain